MYNNGYKTNLVLLRGSFGTIEVKAILWCLIGFQWDKNNQWDAFQISILYISVYKMSWARIRSCPAYSLYID